MIQNRDRPHHSSLQYNVWTRVIDQGIWDRIHCRIVFWIHQQGKIVNLEQRRYYFHATHDFWLRMLVFTNPSPGDDRWSLFPLKIKGIRLIGSWWWVGAEGKTTDDPPEW